MKLQKENQRPIIIIKNIYIATATTGLLVRATMHTGIFQTDC